MKPMQGIGWAHSKRRPTKPVVKNNGFYVPPPRLNEPLLYFHITDSGEVYCASDEVVAKRFEQLLIMFRIRHTRGSHV